MVGDVEQPVAGTANIFDLPADDQRSARLSAVRTWLASETDDALWLSDVPEAMFGCWCWCIAWLQRALDFQTSIPHSITAHR